MHRTLEELQAMLPAILEAPADLGVVRALCVRPEVDGRRELDEARLSPEEGMVGDRWRASCRRRGADGGPAVDVQLTLMASRAVDAVAGSRERWSLAGDQVFLDLDLREENLPAGTRLRLGEAEIEITAEPHTGCGKFAKRFGGDALRFVNGPERRSLRLRGVHARVAAGGTVRVGDRVRVVRGAAER